MVLMAANSQSMFSAALCGMHAGALADLGTRRSIFYIFTFKNIILQKINFAS